MLSTQKLNIRERISGTVYHIQKRTVTVQFEIFRVAISGLITYKFSSVNAQRSLGFNQINHE